MRITLRLDTLGFNVPEIEHVVMDIAPTAWNSFAFVSTFGVLDTLRAEVDCRNWRVVLIHMLRDLKQG